MKRIKHVIFGFICSCLLISVAVNLAMTQEIHQISQYPFIPGEKISYRMNYSIFTVGKAEVIISPFMYRVSDKKYYRIDMNGRTAGAAQLVSSVNDNWGALLDTVNLLPLRSWRNLEEGRYRKKEFVDYNHSEGKLKVRVYDNSTGTYTTPKEYKFKHFQTRDLISGYLLLRMVDYKNLQKGDTIRLNGFLEDTFYDFNILFMGKEEIDTKLGTIMAYKLVPVMPDNDIFAGENSITAWFSADNVQIPLKIEGKMFIGHVGCEITDLQGTSDYPDFREE